MKKLIKFLKDEEGVSAIEYGLIAAAIAAVIILVVYAVGNKVNNAFEKVNSNLK